ncbi:LlaJI family restriction endonuclease [Parabacteroides sp. TM07-1AC]|uniref:LlaJI family restriction endonuclease n=1 Tax=Parabacteroides sp. TM07-1AC TaxID=2292363 RepID=UPI000EFEC43A|nr:LlaJI family restriction endonuclease [Parabacteroides sp. TM07-1AC]RHU25223.1 LlaJI family restriction endonuclease [Parabacteroides sp. TM07-1AC]
MRILIEGYHYQASDVKDALKGLDFLENVSHEVVVNYVGYLYNPHIRDCVFFLPKVLIDRNGMVFSHLAPATIIHVEKAEELTEEERKFIYEFAVWIYRSLCVFNKYNPKNDIVYHKQMAQAGISHRHMTNTYLEVLLALVEFNRKNQSFFMTVLKNIHSGHNKINWTRTIAHSTTIVQNNVPFYLNPVNKKRQINFDEELLVIFFSILRYINDKYGFPVSMNVGFDLITGAKFNNYLNGFGKVRLRQIEYKYFSDKSLELWGLCYAFFDKSHNISVASELQEYLIAQNYNIVFEAMIDELVGDKKEMLPRGLKDQEDGKRVDHIYADVGLTNTNDKTIYYIGDSKYYKLGNSISDESVYKQYTYARNVIQWNMNLFLDNKEEEKCYRSRLTEGYNIVPNFFISARMDNELSYAQDIYTTENEQKSFISRHFENRLFDRDTLLISHYDVNFLYVVSLYAQDCDSSKNLWKQKVRKRFREEIQEMLKTRFEFYAMTARQGVNGEEYIKVNFQMVLGKLYQPYHRDDYFSLALDKDLKYKNENETLLTELRQYFFVEKVAIGDDPDTILTEVGQRSKPSLSLSGKCGVLMVMMENYNIKSLNFMPTGKIAIGIKYTKESMEIIEHLSELGYLLFHHRNDTDQHLFSIGGTCSVVSADEIEQNVYKNVNTSEMYILVNFITEYEIDSNSLCSTKKGYTSKTRYDAQYSTLHDLINNAFNQ